MNKTLAFIINQVDFVENLGIPFLSATAKCRLEKERMWGEREDLVLAPSASVIQA